MAGLMVCLFARFQEWWDKRDQRIPLVSKINDKSSCYTVHLINYEIFRGVVRVMVVEELRLLVQNNKKMLSQSKMPAVQGKYISTV